MRVFGWKTLLHFYYFFFFHSFLFSHFLSFFVNFFFCATSTFIITIFGIRCFCFGGNFGGIWSPLSFITSFLLFDTCIISLCFFFFFFSLHLLLQFLNSITFLPNNTIMYIQRINIYFLCTLIAYQLLFLAIWTLITHLTNSIIFTHFKYMIFKFWIHYFCRASVRAIYPYFVVLVLLYVLDIWAVR